MKCEKCGKEIDYLDVNRFNHDGSDSNYKYPIIECSDNAAYVDIDTQWTGWELSEEEQMETLVCPECGEFPFKHEEVQVHEIIRAVMFKS